MIPGVTLVQLETFYWCVRLGSFSAAASRLNATQPAVSIRVRDLETLTGVALFERVGRSVRPTAKGRDLFEVAEGFIALGDELANRLRAEPSFRGTMRIGAADTVALTWLPALVSRLADLFPRLEVELVVDLSLHLQNRLRDGDIDLAFLVGGLPGPDFAAVPVGDVENAWMASPSLGLDGAMVPASDLARHPIFTHSRGSHLHRTVQAWFDEAGVRPSRVHGCNSLSTMIRMTVAGLGVSVLPPALLRLEVEEGCLKLLPTDRPLPPNRFVASWSTRPPGATTRAVVDLAKEVAAADPRFAPSGS